MYKIIIPKKNNVFCFLNDKKILMRVYYGKAVYGKEEINASLKVLNKKSLSLIDGPSVKKLENKVAHIFGKKYGLMVNSGSSANLLAFASLKLKKEVKLLRLH